MIYVYNEYTQTNDYPVPVSIIEKAYTWKVEVDNWIKKHNIPQAVLDEWQAQSDAAKQDANENKKFWQKMRDKYKAIKTTVTTTLNNASDSISNAWLNSSAGQAAVNMQNQLNEMIADSKEKFKLAVISPFKPLMVNALKQKGYNVSNNDPLLKILFMFQDVIVLNKSNINFSDYANFRNLEAAAETAVIGAAASAGAAAAAAGGVPIPAGVIDSAIRTVMKFIQNITQKKKKGEQVTPQEEAIIANVEQIDIDDVKDQTGFSPLLKVVAFAVGVFVIYKIFVKK